MEQRDMNSFVLSAVFVALLVLVAFFGAYQGDRLKGPAVQVWEPRAANGSGFQNGPAANKPPFLQLVPSANAQNEPANPPKNADQKPAEDSFFSLSTADRIGIVQAF